MEKEQDIIDYIENNQPEFYWDQRDYLSKEDVMKIISGEEGIHTFYDELLDLNLDYISDMEHEFLNNVYNEFDLSCDYDEFVDKFLGYVCIDFNFKQLLNNTPDLTAILVVYSNYDCCNSFDNPKEPESYLSDVFKRVKTGVKRKDYEFEFYNGAYGGSLFCFAFKTDVETLVDLRKKLNNGAEYIYIPKGTQFGFFSSFQGAGSVFEKTTYRNMKLKISGETKYDTIDIVADIEQSYSMQDVYGTTSWISDQSITT